MRLSILLVAAHFAVLGCGSSGSAAGWSGLARQKSTAAGGRRVFDRQERRSHYCCSVLAFGGSPSSRAAERKLDATEAAAAAAAAAGVSPDIGAEDVVKVASSKNDPGSAAATAPASAPTSLVQGLVNTVKDFVVDAKIGTVALWTNFQVSQDIRKRVKGGHQLTYAEHTHLERGGNDRRKLLQFVIIYAISPETFPYVVLYAPSLLPSTYEKPHTVRSNYNRLSHERVGAALGGIAQLEKQVLDAKAKLKGKERKEGTRPTKRIEELEMQREKTLEILEMGSKREIFERLQEHMVTPDPALEVANSDNKKKKPQKLPSAGSGVPGPAIKAMGRGMGMAGWRGIAPGFYVKYRLNEHVKDLGKSDEILRRMPLDSLSSTDLNEACNSRGIDVAGGSRDPKVLRRALTEWLELTSAEVAARNVAPDMVFLPDRARLLGLGLNILEGSRQGESGVLTRKALLSSW